MGPCFADRVWPAVTAGVYPLMARRRAVDAAKPKTEREVVMMFPAPWRRRAQLAGLVVVLLGVAACGSAASSPSPTSSTGSSASTAGGLQLLPKPSLNGSALSTPAGLTLYQFDSDSGGQPTCTGGCATTWPPFPATAAPPLTPAGLTGTFGTVTRSDGTTQLTYDSWPLYTYSGDSSTSDANGQGSGGKWFAVTASTAPASSATNTPAGVAPAPTSASAVPSY
jgi:predicted lipoprotein with Yx(FWY)xxD motif